MSQWAGWLDTKDPPNIIQHHHDATTRRMKSSTSKITISKDENHDDTLRLNVSALQNEFRERFWRCLSPGQDFAKNLSPSKRGKASEINGQVRLAQHK